MTTPDPAAVALLAEALTVAPEPSRPGIHADAAAILSHPRLARALAIGTAWLAAEEALPAICVQPNSSGICGKTERWVTHLPDENGVPGHPFLSLAALTEKLGETR